MYISKRIENIVNYEKELAQAKIEVRMGELVDRLSFRLSYENPQSPTDRFPVFFSFLGMGLVIFAIVLWGNKFSIPIELQIIFSIGSIIVFAPTGIVSFFFKKEIKQSTMEDDLKALLNIMHGNDGAFSVISKEDQIEVKFLENNELGFVWKKSEGINRLIASCYNLVKQMVRD